MNTNTEKAHIEIPEILCGPIIRRCTEDKLVLWWISSQRYEIKFQAFFNQQNNPDLELVSDATNTKIKQVGERAFVNLMEIKLGDAFPLEQKIEYDFLLKSEEDNQEKSLFILTPGILYDGETRPSFIVRKKLNKILHGSCRNPHYDSDDSFMGADREVGNTLNDVSNRPAVMILTGDQIYADDVAGPMLQAIHRTIEILGLYGEVFEGHDLSDSEKLYLDPRCYYLRQEILPRTTVGRKWYNRGGLFHIFTSRYAGNHLITFAEWIAMYILVWSPALWQDIIINICSSGETFALTLLNRQFNKKSNATWEIIFSPNFPFVSLNNIFANC